MTSHHGKRQAIRRTVKHLTTVTCESCHQTLALPPTSASEAFELAGWWRPDHDLALCDGCYTPATEVTRDEA
jgi:hypothetical protein